MKIKLLLAVLMCASAACAQTALENYTVDALHLADAGQTCWHMQQAGNVESGIGTPHNCSGATAALVGSGVVIQILGHFITERWPRTQRFYRGVQHAEMAMSANAIRCSNSGGCNKYGF